MRTWIVSMLGAALLIFSAGSATAYTISIEVRGGVKSIYEWTDTVTIDVFLDATGPITLLSIPVLSTANFTYCASCSAALPIIHPGLATSGAQPSYILYAPAAGTQFSTALYPQQTPAFLTFTPPSRADNGSAHRLGPLVPRSDGAS